MITVSEDRSLSTVFLLELDHLLDTQFFRIRNEMKGTLPACPLTRVKASSYTPDVILSLAG